MAKRKKRVTIAKKRPRSSASLRPLTILLFAVIVLAGIALTVSYFYLKNSRLTEPALSELKLANGDDAGMAEEAANGQTLLVTDQAQKNELQSNTWVSTLNGAMLTFKGDQYTIDFPSVEAQKPLAGSVLFSHNGFVLVNQSIDDVCERASGEYEYRFDGEDLVIRMKSDSCRKRSTVLETVWFKL